MYQILLVDDHNMVRYGIRRILQELLSTPVQIEEASTGLQAISLNRKCEFDLVLLDISLPDRNGLEVLKQLRLYSTEHIPTPPFTPPSTVRKDYISLPVTPLTSSSPTST